MFLSQLCYSVVTLTSTLSGSSPRSHYAFALSRLPGFPDTGCPDRTLFCWWVGRVAWIQMEKHLWTCCLQCPTSQALLISTESDLYITGCIIICYDLMNLKWWRDSLQPVDMHSHTHTFGTIPLRSRQIIGIILWWTNVWIRANVYPCVSIEYVLFIYNFTRCLMMFASLYSTVLNPFLFLYSRRPVAESPSITSWQRHVFVSHWKTMVIQEWKELTANMSHPTDQTMLFIR